MNFPNCLSWFLLIILICIKLSESNNKGSAAQRILNEILGPSYDKNIRAFNNASAGEDAPTIVSVNMYFRSLRDINDVRMEFQTQITFRMQWLDSRLAYSGKRDADRFEYLSLSSVSRIWTPDMFFSNEVSGHMHDLLTPNFYVRIFPDGNVLYSVRLTLSLSCPMILKEYPFDRQTCSIRMASYGYTTEDIIFKWKSEDPVQVTRDLPNFLLEELSTHYCDSLTNTGTYSCLRVDLLLSREFSRYFINIYIPCTMLVVLAWLSLWLEHNGPGSTGRLLMGIATLLVMATLVQSFNANEAPPVSYTKQIDIWTGVCLTFVFSTIVEFIVVNYMARNKILCENQDGDDENRGDSSTAAPATNVGKGSSGRDFMDEMRDWRTSGPSAIDIVARIAYPILFLLFVIIHYASSG